MMVSTLQGLSIPEGVVTQIAKDGVVLWSMANNAPIVLEVEKITATTYAGSTSYTNEQFILLDIYPKTNGTVNVTYGGLTKTITDTSGAEEPNAQQVFFGTFNGVSDSVTTPTSGELTVEGDYKSVGVSMYVTTNKGSSVRCACVTGIVDFGGIKTIGDGAFCDCVKLQSLMIPKSVKNIGSTTLLAYGAFQGCTGLTDVTISNGVQQIGTNAFAECTGLTSMFIPASVKHLGNGYGREQPFLGTNTDNFITIDSDNAYYKIDGNCLITKSSRTKLVAGFNNSNIPSYVTSIGDYAFYGCTKIALTSLPSGVTSIGDSAFSKCTNLALTSLPSGVTSIGNHAFNNCINLALTSLPSGLTSIENYAFCYCEKIALTSLPSGVTSIGHGAFNSCTNLALTSLPSGVTSIGDSAFNKCTNLALTSLPSGLTSIESYAFNSCTKIALTSLPSGVTSIGDYAFYNCEKLVLTSLPSGVTSIGHYAFHYCGKINITEIPDGVTSIGDYAFYMYCVGTSGAKPLTAMTEITLPATITSLGDSCFAYTVDGKKKSVVSKVTILATTPPTISPSTFGSGKSDLQIVVPKGCGATYKAAGGWSTYASYITEAS